MAENHHGYGPYLGQYPPAYFPQTSVSSSTQSPYNAIPQNGGIPSTNYAASQGAYEYNANRIPGLGLGGPSIPLTSLPPSVATSWSAQTLKSQTDSHFQNQPQFSASLLGEQVPQQSVSHRPSDNALEEGELSEGEFEDLYEPKDSTDVSQTVPQNHHAQTSSALDQRNSSVGDADGSSIYDPNSPQDESMVPTTSNSLPGAEHEYPPDDEWEPSFQDRERSGSYSPYLSPREVHRKISIAKATPREIKAPNTSISSQLPPDTGISLPTSSREVTLSNGATHAASGPSGNMATASNSEVDCHVNGALPLRSPLEFKKKAQEAILGLWPLKVRYQDYIEEGLDADVVKALFKDLGLDASVSKPATASAKPVSTSQAVPTTAATVPNTSPKRKSQSLDNKQPLSQDTKHPDNKDNNDKSSEVKVAEKSAAEERKDKIARKLAAMAQKTTTTQPPVRNASAPAQATAPPRAPSPAPIPVSAPTEETATAAPIGAKSDTPNALSATPKTRAENNAILQQKLAALKKQQAQLAADKALAASNESTAASSPTAAEPNSTDVGRNGVSTSKVTTTPLAQPNSNQRSQSAERRASSKDESIPGLSVSLSSFSQPAQGSTRNLKRPVASDFDNYTPRSQSLKRSRTEERLIIDVSDDEDVEMDMGSPTDELVTSIEPTTAPTRQSLSAFPPLSDTPTRRQRLSPASSSAPTPPAPGAKLDLLHKRIEETKRLIAEAEAKKAAKKATSQQSPRPSSPITQQSVKLPKANEASAENKVAGTHRRERIMSYELPRINATLKEKQDKLKWIVAQAAQLELEVQASLDEQQKLTAEVERLVDFSGEDSLQPEEQPLQATISKFLEAKSQLPA
ncbi:hypothetical protein F5Y19DRAFT_419436 [Xylariaceae sp. FL1651]|nr:hypothetical protein F5Y19DRAFT_419436 [Xylariaceae sp. FL1651]